LVCRLDIKCKLGIWSCLCHLLGIDLPAKVTFVKENVTMVVK
jgi:hypothetical protein